MTASSKAFSLVEVRPGPVAPSCGGRPRLAAVSLAGPDTAPGAASPESPPGVVLGLVRGVVLPGETGQVRIALDGGDVATARRAAGCLLRPEAGDTVLLHVPEAGEAYVLSVLEKKEGVSVLEAPGELRIESSRRLDLAAPEIRLRGASGRFHFTGLDLLAGAMTAKVGRVAAVAAVVESRIGDLTQTVRQAVRQVETQVLRAGSIRTFIRDRLLVRAGRAAILADDEVTVDAKKIHLG